MNRLDIESRSIDFLLDVSTISDEIGRFTETGIVTADGKEWEFDIIVCATGFDVAFAPHLWVLPWILR